MKDEEIVGQKEWEENNKLCIERVLKRERKKWAKEKKELEEQIDKLTKPQCWR